MTVKTAGGDPSDVSLLLDAWQAGEDEALERLAEAVYAELRQLAGKKMHRERAHHTLRPTELVHEAFVRLMNQRTSFENRAHFLGIAGKVMRRLLLDYARRRSADKRPDGGHRVTLSGLVGEDSEQALDPLDLEAALVELARIDQRAVQVVELRAFAGCTAAETATVLDVSQATVARDWRMARAWLGRRLGRQLGRQLGRRVSRGELDG